MLFSIGFTLSVLIFSEIIPKVLGVAYNQPLARALALPWHFVVTGMTPVIWCVERITRILKPNEPFMAAPEEEVEQMARMSARKAAFGITRRIWFAMCSNSTTFGHVRS